MYAESRLKDGVAISGILLFIALLVPLSVASLQAITKMNKNLADLDLKQQLFENTRYDGKLIWKIDSIDYRMKQAVTGRVTALHSSPSFTEKNGYKFCARLYLNGDGVGKCSHVYVSSSTNKR